MNMVLGEAIEISSGLSQDCSMVKARYPSSSFGMLRLGSFFVCFLKSKRS